METTTLFRENEVYFFVDFNLRGSFGTILVLFFNANNFFAFQYIYSARQQYYLALLQQKILQQRPHTVHHVIGNVLLRNVHAIFQERQH